VQLTQLNRQMDNLREQLQSVAARRSEAEISYQLETQRQSERLTVLEPASLPDYAYTRSRKMLVVMGAFASLIAGIGTAFLLDLRTPVIRSARQMERELGLLPVVSIPQARPQKSSRRGLFSRLFGTGRRKPKT
jgi:capsular polysaccharide biosynthesis protein